MGRARAVPLLPGFPVLCPLASLHQTSQTCPPRPGISHRSSWRLNMVLSKARAECPRSPQESISFLYFPNALSWHRGETSSPGQDCHRNFLQKFVSLACHSPDLLAGFWARMKPFYDPTKGCASSLPHQGRSACWMVSGFENQSAWLGR